LDEGDAGRDLVVAEILFARVTELAMAAATPAANPMVLGDDAGRPSSRVDPGDRRAHVDRRVGEDEDHFAAVSELAREVVAPTPELAVDVERAGVGVGDPHV